MNQRQNKKERKWIGMNWVAGEAGETEFIPIPVEFSHIFTFVHSPLCKINLRKLTEWSLPDIYAEVIISELCWYPHWKINGQMEGMSSWINTQHSKMRSYWNSGVNMQGIEDMLLSLIYFWKVSNKNIWGKGTWITKTKQQALLIQGRYFYSYLTC